VPLIERGAPVTWDGGQDMRFIQMDVPPPSEGFTPELARRETERIRRPACRSQPA